MANHKKKTGSTESILAVMADGRERTAAQVAAALPPSLKATSSTILGQLVTRGRLERSGAHRAYRYRLAQREAPPASLDPVLAPGMGATCAPRPAKGRAKVEDRRTDALLQALDGEADWYTLEDLEDSLPSWERREIAQRLRAQIEARLVTTSYDAVRKVNVYRLQAREGVGPPNPEALASAASIDTQVSSPDAAADSGAPPAPASGPVPLRDPLAHAAASGTSMTGPGEAPKVPLRSDSGAGGSPARTTPGVGMPAPVTHPRAPALLGSRLDAIAEDLAAALEDACAARLQHAVIRELALASNAALRAVRELER